MKGIGDLKPSLDAKKESHVVTRRTPLAEGEGFKPPIPERGIPDFESSAIDHSANLPLSVLRVQRYNNYLKLPNKRDNLFVFYRRQVSPIFVSKVLARTVLF